MKTQVLWLATVLFLITGMMAAGFVACGDDDDDDDDDTADDDDDSSDDDDDDASDDDAADDDATDDDATDDDATDDDGGDYCTDVVSAFVAYCPDVDYDTIYGIVCETNNDPECLEYCYNAYDDCTDIANCYDTNECVA